MNFFYILNILKLNYSNLVHLESLNYDVFLYLTTPQWFLNDPHVNRPGLSNVTM